MKKAIIILYVIVGTEALAIAGGFAANLFIMKQAITSASESLIKFCDERYIQK